MISAVAGFLDQRHDAAEARSNLAEGLLELGRASRLPEIDGDAMH
jgi:hypothetical protein